MRSRTPSALLVLLVSGTPLAETAPPTPSTTTAESAAESAASDQDAAAVRTLIESANQAISERDLERLLATFAEGAVRVDAFPAHRFGAAASGADETVKAVDLADRWKAVAPILFSSTSLYQRRIRGMDVHIDNDLAVAWVVIETAMLGVGEETAAAANRFREIYILRREDDGWKLVAITNNRRDAAS